MDRSAQARLLGHPPGLAWLTGAEFWERFSYYGMQALLVLYMTHDLLLPGHIEHVLGFGPFRRAIESVYGPLSPQALGSAVFGLYAGLVYVTPLAGGLLADRLTGRTAAVAGGAALMALGHFLMAFEASFLMALLCLLIGVGCFKGNIATQVGALYAPGDRRRATGFQIYMFGIQLAVIVSPLVCGTLGQKVGWHWGFGAAGIGMVVGLAIYLAGRGTLPSEARHANRLAGHYPASRPRLTAAEWQTVLVLLALLPVLALSALGNMEIFNAYLIWGEANYRLDCFGYVLPITWILSAGAVVSAATIAGSVAFWRWYARRWREPDEITKIAIGTGIAALGPLILALAASLIAASGQKAGLGWALAFQIANDLGFSNVFPVGLALYSRAAPQSVVGLIIGAFYTHLFLANLAVGWLGGLLERMPPTQFWLLHAGLVGAAAVILLMVRGAAGRMLAPYDGGGSA